MSHPTTTTANPPPDPPLPSLPPISLLPSLSLHAQTTILDLLFEPTPALLPLVTPLLAPPSNAPASYDAFIDAVRARLHALAASVTVAVGDADSSGFKRESEDPEARRVLEDVLAAHPRLGEKRVESAMSRMEQARMAAAAGGGASASGPASATASASTGEVEEAEKERQRQVQLEAEAQMLRELNREYEERFPGLRYVVFVNGRSRSVVMEDMRRRIARGDVKAERLEAVDAMCDIAKDRCRKLGVED